VRIPVVLVFPEYYLFILLLSFYSAVIMDDSEFIDDNGDSFIDIDEFDSDDDGADIEEPNDNNGDPTIPLSNIKGTPLDTIDEEDEGPIFGPQPKKTGRGTGILSIGQRIQGLYQLDRGDPVFKVIEDSGVSKASLYKIREKAIASGWVPGTPIEPRHVDDRPRSGRPRVSTYITAAILTILTRNSTTRGYSCRRIAQEVSSHLPGKQFVSASTVWRTLIAEGYGSYKRTVKPGLNQENKDKRLAWCIAHSIENGWDLEKWKTVIWTDETSVQLGSVRGKRRIWRKPDEAYHQHVVVERWKGFQEFM